MTTTPHPARTPTRGKNLTLTELIDRLTALRDTHGDTLGDKPVRVADGRAIRSVTVTDTGALLHQKPHLHYRHFDGVVLRDNDFAGHIHEMEDNQFAAYSRDRDPLGTAHSLPEALALFDQEP